MSDRESLLKIAKKKGFRVSYCSLCKDDIGNCNFSKKIITLSPNINNTTNFILSHEIGHASKISRRFRYLCELSAWAVGFIICKQNRIKTNGFLKLSKHCLNSYTKEGATDDK